MEIVENSLDVTLGEFLRRPLFSFLGQQSTGGPRISPLWFLWEDDALWNIARLDGRSYPERVRREPRTAVAVVDFDPTASRVEHVGMRGEAELVPYDEARAERLFRKYLGERPAEWPEMFLGLDADEYRLIRFDPDTVVARDQSYGFAPGTRG